MKKSLPLIISLFLLYGGCMEYWDCPIQEWPAFTEGDLEWFEFTLGDTIYFNDNLGNDSVFLTCVSRQERTDTTATPQDHCSDGFQLEIEHFVNYSFTSSIPHGNNRYLMVNMELNSLYGCFNIEMAFNDAANNFYFFWFRYNTDEYKLYNWRSGNVNNIGSISINGKEYSDVFAINHSDDEGPYPNAYYDTIYYNSEGFLKFISNKYEYILERLP